MTAREQPHEGFQPVLALAGEHLGCDRAGVAVRAADGVVITLAASDGVVAVADVLQTAHSDGPAATPGWPTPQVAMSLDEPAAWPVWSRGVAGLGIAGVLATQITTPAGETGALTLYYSSPISFAPHTLTLASVLGQYAARELHHLRHGDHLRTALESRTRIGQAQGILMDQYGLSVDEAFAVLRRHSQDTNIKLHDVAAAVVETGHLDAYAVGQRR